MVTRELPATVYRRKGIVYTDESPDEPFVIQVVGRRVDLAPLDAPRGDETSEIVAIGRRLDEEELDRLFAGVLIADPG